MRNILFTLSAVSLLVASANAQPAAPPPQWSVVTVSQIKADSRQEYEAYQKEVTATYKKAGVSSRAVLQTIMGDILEYVSVYPIAKLADFDGPSPTEKVLGKDGAAKLLKRGGALITGIHRTVVRALPELSLTGQMKEPPAYSLVISYRIKPGKADEFTSWMKDQYLPVMKKGGVANFWVSQPLFGGEPNERVTVRPLSKLGDLDDGPITTKVLGAEGARKLSAQSAGIVDSTHYVVVRYRTDLSYQVLPPPATK